MMQTNSVLPKIAVWSKVYDKTKFVVGGRPRVMPWTHCLVDLTLKAIRVWGVPLRPVSYKPGWALQLADACHLFCSGFSCFILYCPGIYKRENITEIPSKALLLSTQCPLPLRLMVQGKELGMTVTRTRQLGKGTIDKGASNRVRPFSKNESKMRMRLGSGSQAMALKAALNVWGRGRKSVYSEGVWSIFFPKSLKGKWHCWVCEQKESSRESSLLSEVCVSQGYEGCQMHGSFNQKLEGRQIASHTEDSLDGARQVKASPKERPWFLLTGTIWQWTERGQATAQAPVEINSSFAGDEMFLEKINM